MPQNAGDTANITYAISSSDTVNVDTPEIVGIINVGDATSAYNISGDALTMNNSGAGAQINEVSGSVGDTVSAPIVLGDNLTINNNATATTGTMTIGGGITGTDNVTVNNNSGNTTGTAIQFNTATINNVGTLTFDGTTVNTTADAIRFNAGIGSNVTSIIQDGATLAHLIGGQTISGTETYVNNGTAPLQIGQNSITGTGDIVVDNNTTINANVDLSYNGITINTVGKITSEGTGTGQSNLGTIGSGVTSLNVDAASPSGLRVNGTININTSGNTDLVNNSATAEIMTVGGVTGTGNLVLDNNSTGSIVLAQNQQNNTGQIINQGTGSGGVGINNSNVTLGANLTAVVQDSPTSGLELRLGSTSPFTGSYIVKQGTMTLSGGDSTFAGGTQFIVGDTSAHSAAILQLNIDGGTWTPTAAQTVSGFGSITNQNVASVAGTAFAPGSAGNLGTLTISKALSLVAGTNLDFALGTPGSGLPSTGGSNDLLAVGGALALGSGTFNLNLADNANANSQGSLGAGTYELLSYGSLSGASTGDITSLFNISGPGGFSYAVSDTSLGAGQIDLTVTSVPEPASLGLLGLGALGLLIRRRRTA